MINARSIQIPRYISLFTLVLIICSLYGCVHKKKIGGPYYFKSAAKYSPWDNPSEEIGWEDARQLNNNGYSYQEVYYDQKGRLIRICEISKERRHPTFHVFYDGNHPFKVKAVGENGTTVFYLCGSKLITKLAIDKNARF